MKYLWLFFLLSFSVSSFSQNIDKPFKNKLEEFDFYAKPNKDNKLSRYFRNHIDLSLLDAVKFSSSDENEKRIFLTFRLKKNKPIGVRVNSPYSELNNNIKAAFVKYDIKNLDIKDKSPLNIYTLQIASKTQNNTIVNASEHVVIDRYPVFAGCEDVTSNSRMKSCINKQLQKHIVNHISVEEVIKAKALGFLEIKPKFQIDDEGNISNVDCKTRNGKLIEELNRVVALFPKAIRPPMRNGKSTNVTFNGFVSLQIDSPDGKYEKEVIKTKDSLVSSVNDLALHFKKHLSANELNKVVFPIRKKTISVRFSLDKKGRLIDATTSLKDKKLDARIVSVFKRYPLEKLNITSNDILEMYSFNIISRINKKNIIQCSNNAIVEKYPVYKGCSRAKSPKESRNCLSKGISTLILRKFDSNLHRSTQLTGKIRMYCIFKIDTDGEIIDVKVKAPNPYLANEVQEIIKKAPKALQPGFQNGKPVKVPYSLPIVFQISSKSNTANDNPFKD